MKHLDQIILALLIIGGLNWAAWGLWETNILEYLLAPFWLDRLLYILMGLGSLYLVINWNKIKFGAKK